MAESFFSAEDDVGSCMSSLEESSDSEYESDPFVSETDWSPEESASETFTAVESGAATGDEADTSGESSAVPTDGAGGECKMADASYEGEVEWGPPGDYVPEIPLFTEVPGVKVDTAGYDVLDFFHLFVTDAILQNMVLYTNVHAERHIALHQKGEHATSWYPTSLAEMKIFVALTLAMGLVKTDSLDTYWDTDSVITIPLFFAAMSLKRYQALLQFLHFNDYKTAVPPGEPGHDKLHKLRPLLESLSQRFREVYTPSHNICIKSLLLYKGRIPSRHELPSERYRNRIKFFKLCEISSGYTSHFMIYEGKDSILDPPGCPLGFNTGDKMVWSLVTPLMGRGYHLYFDNPCTSIPLFRALYCLDTPACGPIVRKRKELPAALLDRKLKRGETHALRSNELLVVKLRDPDNVFLLSSIHDQSEIIEHRTGRRNPKNIPVCYLDYTRHIDNVTKTDRIKHYYNPARRAAAWSKKMGLYLIHVAVYNSYVVYKSVLTGAALSFYNYQLKLVSLLLFGDIEKIPEITGGDNAMRLVGKHFISSIPPTPSKQHPQRACRVCRKKGVRRDVRYYCPKCPSKPPLCLKPCFELYHTELHYDKLPFAKSTKCQIKPSAGDHTD